MFDERNIKNILPNPVHNSWFNALFLKVQIWDRNSLIKCFNIGQQTEEKVRTRAIHVYWGWKGQQSETLQLVLHKNDENFVYIHTEYVTISITMRAIWKLYKHTIPLPGILHTKENA